MTTKHSDNRKPPPGKKLLDAVKELLDRVREEAEELNGLLNPQARKPALQPVPVRRPGYRRGR